MTPCLRFACVAIGLSLSPTAFAQDIPFPNSLGITVRMDDARGPAADPGGRLTRALIDMQGELGKVADGTPPKVDTTSGKAIAVVARKFANDPGQIHMLVASDAGSGICHIRAPAKTEVQQQIPQLLLLCLGQFGKAPASATTPPPAPRPQTAASGKYAPNWAQVDGVWFRGTTGVGVGGMMIMDFEPLILFKDGTYYEIDEAALEDIDLAAERRAHPKRWGRWTKSGTSYVLTGSSGKPNSYDPANSQFFKAYPAEAGKLAPAYKRVSGGGNTAMGGEVMIAVQNKIRFSPDGRFTSGADVGAFNNGSQSGVGSTVGSSKRQTAPGTYTVKNYTLTLTYPDGRQERSFFAFGSRRNPTQVITDMIFIGDRVYTDDD